MRFRKLRSYLSAYSNDELTGKKHDKVREQLAGNKALRREDAVFKSIKKACKDLPDVKMSDDFNAKLLDRIANERFAETRKKAYLPRRAPLFVWRRVVPVAVTAAVALFVGVTMFSPSSNEVSSPMADKGVPLDDSYMTVQPDQNPNLTRGFSGRVSLQDLMAKVDRADEISDFLTRSKGFVNTNRAGGMDWMASTRTQTPFGTNYYRVRPVVKVAVPVTSKEGDRVY